MSPTVMIASALTPVSGLIIDGSVVLNPPAAPATVAVDVSRTSDPSAASKRRARSEWRATMEHHLEHAAGVVCGLVWCSHGRLDRNPTVPLCTTR